MLEIERKFLVTSDAFRSEASRAARITQGYLCATPERTVRIRIAGDEAWLTIKGAGSDSGVSRYEWEMLIPRADGETLMALCEPGAIDKTRHYVPVGTHVFEVDEFHGANVGLIVAEVELSAEDEAFPRPQWLGAEVTLDERYHNAALTKKPFCDW